LVERLIYFLLEDPAYNKTPISEMNFTSLMNDLTLSIKRTYNMGKWRLTNETEFILEYCLAGVSRINDDEDTDMLENERGVYCDFDESKNFYRIIIPFAQLRSFLSINSRLLTISEYDWFTLPSYTKGTIFETLIGNFELYYQKCFFDNSPLEVINETTCVITMTLESTIMKKQKNSSTMLNILT